MLFRYKSTGQPTVFDEIVKKTVVKNKTTIIDQVNQYIDFEIFRKSLERTFKASQFGPDRFDVILMLRIIMLQQWYELSDPETEHQISDRITFREFVGLSLMDKVPDETTIGNFRNHLMQTGVYEWIFEVLNDELDKRHILVKKGSIFDSTFIEAPKGKRKNGKKTDTDAQWGKKGHGYSMHTNIDIDSKLIRDIDVTSAEVHDSQPDMTIGDEKALFGDKAFCDDDKKRQMRKDGIYCGILDKAKRNHPLSKKQKNLNKKKSRVRSQVEHPYAQIKYNEDFTRSPYIGLKKTRCKLFLKCIAYNIRRGVYLLKKQVKNVLEVNKKEFLENDPRPNCV